MSKFPEDILEFIENPDNQESLRQLMAGSHYVAPAFHRRPWKTVEVGGETAEELLQKLEAAQMDPTELLRALLLHPEMVFLPAPTKIKLCRFRLWEWFYDYCPTPLEIFNRSQELGMLPVPLEATLPICLGIEGDSTKYLIGHKPIDVSLKCPQVHVDVGVVGGRRFVSAHRSLKNLPKVADYISDAIERSFPDTICIFRLP
jgi:hypothetical protein